MTRGVGVRAGKRNASSVMRRSEGRALQEGTRVPLRAEGEVEKHASRDVFIKSGTRGARRVVGVVR